MTCYFDFSASSHGTRRCSLFFYQSLLLIHSRLQMHSKSISEIFRDSSRFLVLDLNLAIAFCIAVLSPHRISYVSSILSHQSHLSLCLGLYQVKSVSN